MISQEFLYNHSSVAITAALFLLILLFNEIGFHIGRYVQGRTSNEIKSLTGSIQASILGLLALLLGFTFNMSMQRYDHRNQALIEEANSIGTAVLRAELLPAVHRDAVSEKLKQYIELRIAISGVDLTHQAERKQYNQQIAALQGELWSLAVLATQDDPRPVTTGAFVKALNDLIDSQSKRNALLQMHVPEVVLFLLFIVFIASGGILGYSSGLSSKRVVAPAALVSFLIALIVFIIIDLDRPKRGLIQVDQAIMLELRQDTPKPVLN
ncbi:MAG TPA: hypothetical protein VIN38_08530 [Thiobacillus sp.]